MPADCPLTFHPLPSSSGQQCSGHGAPVAAQGVCQCYVGYDGTSCSECADGYQRVSGICQRTLTSFRVQAALAATAQANASSQKVRLCLLALAFHVQSTACCCMCSLISTHYNVYNSNSIRMCCSAIVACVFSESDNGLFYDADKWSIYRIDSRRCHCWNSSHAGCTGIVYHLQASQIHFTPCLLQVQPCSYRQS